MKHIYYSMIAAGLLAVSGCKTPMKTDSSYARSNFEVTCLGTDLDGTQTLRAFGKGKDKKQAMMQAQKNAVRAVIFKGITSGTGECNKRPLVTTVNAEEKFEAYFNKFFADGGPYSEYVSLDDEKFGTGSEHMTSSRIKAADSSIENWGVVVRVDRAALKARLIKDSIIKQ